MSRRSGHCLDGHCEAGPQSTGCTYPACDHSCHDKKGDDDANKTTR